MTSYPDAGGTETLELEQLLPSGLNRIGRWVADTPRDVETGSKPLAMGNIEPSEFIPSSEQFSWVQDQRWNSVGELLAASSCIASVTIRNFIAAALFNWVTLRTYRSETAAMHVSSAFLQQAARQLLRIGVSAALKVPRDALTKTALITPSGPSLIWQEILEDERNGKR